MNVLRMYLQPGLFLYLTISFFLSNVVSGIIGSIVYMLLSLKVRCQYHCRIIFRQSSFTAGSSHHLHILVHHYPAHIAMVRLSASGGCRQYRCTLPVYTSR